MKKKVYFKSCNVKICATLNSPKKSPKSNLNDFAIILCHGLSTKRSNTKNRLLTALLSKKGISTFAFDFYAHNESGGKFEELTQTKSIENIKDAVSYLKKQGYKRFAVFGSSFGGAAAIGAASKLQCFEFVATTCPVSSYKKVWTKENIKRWGVYPKFVDDGLKYDFFKLSEKITCPTLIVNGDKDNITPLNGAKKLFESMSGEKMMVIINGADHHFKKTNKHQKDMINAVYNFMIYNLPRN